MERDKKERKRDKERMDKIERLSVTEKGLQHGS